jgi:hypothetical protein
MTAQKALTYSIALNGTAREVHIDTNMHVWRWERTLLGTANIILIKKRGFEVVMILEVHHQVLLDYLLLW